MKSAVDETVAVVVHLDAAAVEGVVSVVAVVADVAGIALAVVADVVAAPVAGLVVVVAVEGDVVSHLAALEAGHLIPVAAKGGVSTETVVGAPVVAPVLAADEGGLSALAPHLANLVAGHMTPVPVGVPWSAEEKMCLLQASVTVLVLLAAVAVNALTLAFALADLFAHL